MGGVVEFALGVVNVAVGKQVKRGCRRGSLVVCNARSGVLVMVSFRRRMRTWRRS